MLLFNICINVIKCRNKFQYLYLSFKNDKLKIKTLRKFSENLENRESLFENTVVLVVIGCMELSGINFKCIEMRLA